jgi:Ser/Thr protein kinase RdoA (MazF antagonist)
MLSHFPDPDMPDYSDIRLRENARFVPDAVAAEYDLENATITPMDTGSYNIHFRVDLNGELFDLRKSNRPSAPGNLDYESEILIHLRKQDFNLAPEIVPNQNGESNTWHDDIGWTLFRWLGDGPGTHKLVINETGVRSAAQTLAKFHDVSKDFVPTASRANWPIFTVPTINPATWLIRAESLADHYRESIDGGAEDLRQLARRSAEELETVDHSRLTEYMCHGDYRPRNLLIADDEVQGVFDIDTSLRASRLLDLGSAAIRFVPGAESSAPSSNPDFGANFLRTYHSKLPLTEYEIEVLPIFIKWRLLRDVVIYYDKWWLTVREVCADLFAGAADEIVDSAFRS